MRSRFRLPFNPRVLYTLLSALVIIGGAFLAIEYAKGNYRVTKQGFVQESGLLSANSFPTGAEIYVNGRLVSASDDTLYLEPGTYEVELIKDGYWPWKKTVMIEEQLVVQTNAQLFPIAPSLTPLTFTGANRVIPSPDGQKLLFITTTGSSETKNGLYYLDLNNSLLSLQRGPRQLATMPESFDIQKSDFIWSPDSTQIMVLSESKQTLFSTDKLVNLDTLPDISFQRKQILSEWEEEMYLRERQFLKEFPEEVIAIATESAQNVYLSPDKKRLLYTATAEINLPPDLVPPVPAPNSQPQERDLKPGTIYVYDREEDRNFAIGSVKNIETENEGQTDQDQQKVPEVKNLLATDLFNKDPLELSATPSAFRRLQKDTLDETARTFNRYHTALNLSSYQWFPDSKHLVYTTDSSVQIKGYDGTNDTRVYSGPFTDNFVYPWPDGSKLLVLTTFNPDTPLNLYSIDLKR